ncbi:MAG: serine/threonine-protein kinase [Polyangia bacterium]
MFPQILAKKYHVLRELGRGGMGVVYQVLHVETGEQYALKALSGHIDSKGDAIARFRREVKMPSRIDSQHVVKVFESDTAEELGGVPFYVMELLHGCDLRKLLDKGFKFSREDTIWILHCAAECLDKAHSAGIVHRDLKPDNIFLHLVHTSQITVKILDFGIAKINQELLDSKERGQLTATKAMLGTPLYMSPEQAKGGEGRHLLGPATDVWALGLITYELLTGQSYWVSDSLVQHIGQLLFAPMRPPSQRNPELPTGFDAWFARSCAREAGERFQSVGAQMNALASLLAVAPGARGSADLVRAVRAEAPPLIDHRERTMISESDISLIPGAIQTLENGPNDTILQKPGDQTRLVPDQQFLPATAEPGFTPIAERVTAPSSQGPRLLAALGQRKLLIPLAGLFLVGLIALILRGLTPSQLPATPPDLALPPMDLSTPPDLSMPPDLSLPPAKPVKVIRRTGPGPARPSNDASNRPPDKNGRKFFVPPTL